MNDPIEINQELLKKQFPSLTSFDSVFISFLGEVLSKSKTQKEFNEKTYTLLPRTELKGWFPDKLKRLESIGLIERIFDPKEQKIYIRFTDILETIRK